MSPGATREMTMAIEKRDSTAAGGIATTVHIQDMHCAACGAILEERLGALEGVDEVRVDWRRGVARVTGPGPVPAARLEERVREAGYTPGRAAGLPLVSRRPADYVYLLAGVVAVVVIYGAIRWTGLDRLSLAQEGDISLATSILVGLMAGVSSCMALVGGIVLGFAAKWAEQNPATDGWRRFQPHVHFNVGRILGFIAFGYLLGLLGMILEMSVGLIALLTLLAGVLMFVLGLSLLDVFPRIQNVISLPRFLRRGRGPREREYTHWAAFAGGAATVFLPCGFTQTIQVYAMSTGDPMQGALVMGGFVLGTTPAFLTLGGLSSLARGAFGRFFFNTAGVAVLLFGIYNISNGVTVAAPYLASLGQPLPPAAEQAGGAAPEAAGEPFRVYTDVTGHGYEPNLAYIPPETPIRWVFNSKERFTCANGLVVPALGVRRSLQPGENEVIEFVSPAAGEIAYTCTMGMYAGRLVVDGGF